MVSPSLAGAASGQRTKPRILLVSSFDRFLPAGRLIDRGFRSELERRGSNCELLTEYLDVVHFPKEEQREAFATYLQQRYGSSPPQILVAVADDAFDFFVQRRQTLFPGTPLVCITLSASRIATARRDPGVTGVLTAPVSGLRTLSAIPKMLPQVSEINVISGAAEFDRGFDSSVAAAQRELAGKIKINYWAGLPLKEVARRAHSLSAHRTAIFFTSYLRDPDGTAMTSLDALKEVLPNSPVPVFGQYETYLGSGVVGGDMVDITEYGTIGGQVVARLLNGETPAQVGFVAASPYRFRFDARELSRWGISRTSLPIGSQFLFESQSVWKQHPRVMWGIVTAVLLQTALIAGLLLQRRRLRESESLNRGTLDSLTSLVVILDKSGRIIAMNKAWRDAHHAACSRLPGIGVGTNYLEVCRTAATRGDSSVEEIIGGIESVLRGPGEKFQCEYQCATEDRTLWFEMLVLPLRAPRGGAVVKHRDITRHKETEKELRDRDERINLAAESANLALWTIDYGRGESWMNDKGRELYGYAANQPLSRELFLSRVHPDDRSQVETAIATARDGAGLFEMEYRLLLPPGEVRWLIARGRYLRNDKGEISELLGVAVDLTAQVKAREHVAEADRNLAHASRLAVIGELTASIAHEINQPLGAILSNADAAELLLQLPSPPLEELREILSDIRNDDVRASETIKHIRMLSRKNGLALEPVDLNALIFEVLRFVRPNARRRDVILDIDLSAGMAKIKGDKVHLQQVLMNLVVNAIESIESAANSKRNVVIRTFRDGQRTVQISVKDSGKGIPTETLPLLFESFYTTKESGLGLGLAIARSIVEIHDGTISAMNNQDLGATFTVELPLASAA